MSSPSFEIVLKFSLCILARVRLSILPIELARCVVQEKNPLPTYKGPASAKTSSQNLS